MLSNTSVNHCLIHHYRMMPLYVYICILICTWTCISLDLSEKRGISASPISEKSNTTQWFPQEMINVRSFCSIFLWEFWWYDDALLTRCFEGEKVAIFLLRFDSIWTRHIRNNVPKRTIFRGVMLKRGKAASYIAVKYRLIAFGSDNKTLVRSLMSIW